MKRKGIFPFVLGAIFLTFIGILATTWVLAEKINPVLLDEKGNVRNAASHKH